MFYLDLSFLSYLGEPTVVSPHPSKTFEVLKDMLVKFQKLSNLMFCKMKSKILENLIQNTLLASLRRQEKQLLWEKVQRVKTRESEKIK